MPLTHQNLVPCSASLKWDLFCQVADPWGGSFMMESLTDEIYEKGLQVINEVMETVGRDRELCSFERGE